MDLPGTYSLSANSEEELVTRQNIIGNDIDLVFALVDASQLERSMFLLSEVVGIKQPVVVLLNMIDVAKSQGREIDDRRLSELLGVPVLPFVASHGTGMDELYALLEKGNYQRYILQENALKKEYETQIGEVFTELEQKLDWLVFKGSGAILRAYKFLYENGLLFEQEKENFEKLEALEFPPELASQLIERAISFKREDLISKIKENIKRRN